jgi:hypothetical protein
MGTINVYKILKRPLGRPRHRGEDNIRMDLKYTELGRCGLDTPDSG